jgi:hypothetical protein
MALALFQPMDFQSIVFELLFEHASKNELAYRVKKDFLLHP